MPKGGLTQKDYAELIETAHKIVKYERGERVEGYKLVARRVPVGAADVKAARKVTHKTQSAFAKALGVSTKLVQAWEQGWRKPEPMAAKVIRAIRLEPKIVGVLENV